MTGVSPRLAALRQAFDDGFAAPVRPEPRDVEHLLAARIAGTAYALRGRETAGLIGDRTVTGLLGPLPELVGITAARGALVPVYSLATLLGHPRESNDRWLALGRGATPIALAFETFEGFVSVHPAQIVAISELDGGHRHAPEVVHEGATLRFVISLSSLLHAIEQRIGAPVSRKGSESE